MSDGLKNLLSTLGLLDDPGLHFYVSGHSAGSGSGQVLACELAGQLGPGRVSFLGLATPKISTVSYSIPYATEQFSIINQGDVVAQIALDNVVAGIPTGFSTWFGWRSFQWQQLGYCYSMDTDGNLQFVSVENFNKAPVPSDFTNIANTHFLEVYCKRLMMTVQRQSNAPTDSQVIALAGQIVGLPFPGGNSQDFLTSSVINIADANQTVFEGSSTAPLTPQNVSSLESFSGEIDSQFSRSGANIGNSGGSMAYNTVSGKVKVTLIIQDGQMSQSESFVYMGSPGSPLLQAQKAAITLAAKRSNHLGAIQGASGGVQVVGPGSPAITHIRFSDPYNSKIAFVWPTGGYFGPNNNVVQPATYQSLMVSKQIVGTDTVPVTAPALPKQAKPNILLSYPPANIQLNGAFNPNCFSGAAVPFGLWITSFNKFMNYLTQNNTTWGFLGLAQAEQKFVLTNFALVNGIYQFQGNGAAWQSGDKIRLTGADEKGFNGTYKVISLPGGVFSLNSYINTALRAPLTARGQRVQLSNGQPSKDAYLYSDWDELPPKISKKDPAKPYIPITFRRRKSRRV